MGKITLSSVRKSFGDVDVIPSIDLSIEDGEFVVFVGPSGCGKSTLLRLIAGLEDTTGGHIKLDGVEVNGFTQKQITSLNVFTPSLGRLQGNNERCHFQEGRKGSRMGRFG